MKKKILNWLDKKVVVPYLKWNNKKLFQQWEDRKFLESIFVENGVLDLDKYLRLMKMIKRKYKK